MNEKLLTIAIPTYNRNEILLRGLKPLVESLPSSCEIVIVDNASTVPVEDFLLDRLELKHVKVYRNSVNIGVNSNILRCVEKCSTPYIWIVGDDDYIEVGALNRVLDQLESKPVWLNYCSKDIHQPLRVKSAAHNSLESFLKDLSSINELVFMSNNVFENRILQAGIQVGLQNQHMMAPHVVSMLAGLERLATTGEYRIINEELFISISNNSDTETSWPLYQAFIGIIALYQIPFSPRVSYEIRRLIRGARRGWLRNRFLFSAMRAMSDRLGKKQAWLTASSMIGPTLVIDRSAAPATFAVIAAAISAGSAIDRVYRRVKK